MNSTYNLVDVLKTLIRWQKPISLFVGLSLVASIIVSLLLPNYYDSRSIFYPSNPAITDRQALFSQSGNEASLDYFGGKNDVARLLTIATASPTLDYMINTFDLAKHYDYDTATTSFWRSKVKKEFESNLTVVKTENGAVEIIIRDKDAKLAATMVNAMVDLVDKANRGLIISNKQKVLTLIQQKKKEKQEEVDKLSDSLAILIKTYNIVETVTASGDLIVKGNDLKEVEKFKMLRSRNESAMEDLNSVITLADQNEAALKETVSSIYIVEKAMVADKKAWPIRWLIVVATTVVALFFGLVGALLVERMRQIKSQLNA